MKKLLFIGFVVAGLLLGACRENASQENHKDHEHKEGEATHEGHGTPADTMHHEHAPGDTTHNH